MSLIIREAEAKDSALIAHFILALAELEGMRGEVTAGEAVIRDALFHRKEAEVILGLVDDEPAAFALFYPVYSTFTGTANIFLEDLFVEQAYRGQGIGKQVLMHLAQLTIRRGGKRLDWYVLHNNPDGAEFYKKLGARALGDRTTYRMDEAHLNALIQGGI